jgi:predicted  nucleic acid-binding Zn-ribbon protein
VTHVNDKPENSPTSKSEHVITLPVEYYERQQKERDELVQGLMMYRYKFEELDRQVRLLPAPVETIPVKLAEKDQALQRSQEAIKALEEALQREKQRSWWERLWKK